MRFLCLSRVCPGSPRCRSYWAFEHSGLNLQFRSETGFLSTFTAQSVRIFIAHQMSSVFLWSTGICLFTQCIRN